MKRGKGAREGTGPEGERGGRMREKGWEDSGLPADLKISDFGTPHMILVDVSDIFYFFFSGVGEREEASEEVAGGNVFGPSATIIRAS